MPPSMRHPSKTTFDASGQHPPATTRRLRTMSYRLQHRKTLRQHRDHIRNPCETHDSFQNLASMHNASLAHTHIVHCPASASQPATKHINPVNHQPCLANSSSEAKQARTSTMQCTVDPARQTILIITFLTLLGMTWQGVAWHGHGERAQQSTKKATYISVVKRAFVPKRSCHSRYG